MLYRTYRQVNKFCISHFEQILVVRLAYEDPMKTGRQKQYGDPKRIDLPANAPQLLFRRNVLRHMLKQMMRSAVAPPKRRSML